MLDERISFWKIREDVERECRNKMSKRLMDYFIKKSKPQQDTENCKSEKEKTDLEQPSSSLTEGPSTSNPSNE